MAELPAMLVKIRSFVSAEMRVVGLVERVNRRSLKRPLDTEMN
jgi:hypothetical protein